MSKNSVSVKLCQAAVILGNLKGLTLIEVEVLNELNCICTYLYDELSELTRKIVVTICCSNRHNHCILEGGFVREFMHNRYMTLYITL